MIGHFSFLLLDEEHLDLARMISTTSYEQEINFGRYDFLRFFHLVTRLERLFDCLFR
jgi:hypothetical protein